VGLKFRDRFQELHERAIDATGKQEFGDRSYWTGMKMLLESLDSRGESRPGERAVAERLIIKVLSGRLVTEASWKDNAAWHNQKIHRPLVILGVPRTGTSALHQLLSLDPQFQGIEYWLAAAPKARPPRAYWKEDQQYQATVTAVEQAFATAPEVMNAHAMRADVVDECLIPMSQSFISNFFPSMLNVESYDIWFQEQDETPSYRRFKNILRLIGQADARTWLLKNPSHLFGIDALLEVFPDACIIQTHRHPAASIASVTNLLAGLRKMDGSESPDREKIERREIEFWSQATIRTMAAQDRFPERFFNVWQHEIRDDPLNVVDRIYGQFGLGLCIEADRKMKDWAAANPPADKSNHSYTHVVEQNHLTAAFSSYLDRYAL
jgi:hypothetical protein